jgi:hypothetical protein
MSDGMQKGGSREGKYAGSTSKRERIRMKIAVNVVQRSQGGGGGEGATSSARGEQAPAK